MTALALILAATALLPQGAPVSVPSGRAVSFHDMLWDDPGMGAVYRLRFVAPALAQGGPGDESLAADMDALCNEVAVPATEHAAPIPSRIVISLMAAPTPFGEAAPDTPQVFEAYSLRDGRCIWEAF